MPAGQQVLARAFAAEYHEQNKADEVHETVPTDRERPDDDTRDVERSDVQGDRIELRMNEHSISCMQRWRD